MVPLLVLLTIVVFVIVDVATRLAIKRYQESKLKKRRQEALDIGLNLEFTEEAVSLKRVEVDTPKARILAVDDEAIVLDSFRKILVLAGYSIDTVESGREALGLIQKQEYDFVFTDLKMPEMDGLDVVKGVKHLRPDVDVVMITGYATIQSAVDAMKFGAMDYVEKPFTADELIEFVDKLVIRREDRLEHEKKPTIHLVTPSVRVSHLPHEFNVPSGIFFTRSHTWIDIQPNGMLLVGLDQFAEKLLGPIDAVELPDSPSPINAGDPLFAVIRGEERLEFPAPASGTVSLVNNRLPARPELINQSPFEDGWVCGIDPSNLPSDLQAFRIGADAVAWYEDEIERYVKFLRAVGDEDGVQNAEWKAFSLTIREVDGSKNGLPSLEGQART